MVPAKDPKRAKGADEDEFTAAMLKSMCENILQLMTTTIASMAPVCSKIIFL